MLMTKLKSEEVISSLASGKVFIINCHGCKEVGFPEEEAKAIQKKLEGEGKVVGTLTTDYVCNPDELALRLRAPMAKIAEADAVLVFSCGVGVQTISQTSLFTPAAIPSICPASRALPRWNTTAASAASAI